METQIKDVKSSAYVNMKEGKGNDPGTFKSDPELESFAARLKSVIADESVRSFARRCDLSETSVRKYLGAIADPARSILVNMAKAGGVSVEWLATGQGPREPDGEAQTAAPPSLPEEFEYLEFFDVVASAGAGTLVENEQVLSHLAFRRDWLRRHGLLGKRLALLTARGDSMGATVPDGSICLVERYEPLADAPRDGIYVLRWDEHLVVKRLQRNFDGSYDIISDNPAYKPQHVPPKRFEELRIAGRVAWIGHEI
jgi:phage repressor protein C with HTH and peptisase S24 domain